MTIRGEPGTLRHDWYDSEDGARCVVREAYTSSDAFLAHLAAAGPLLGRLVELGGGLELELFGEPSPALLDAVAAFRPRVYHHRQGKETPIARQAGTGLRQRSRSATATNDGCAGTTATARSSPVTPTSRKDMT